MIGELIASYFYSYVDNVRKSVFHYLGKLSSTWRAVVKEKGIVRYIIGNKWKKLTAVKTFDQ